jgi:hypothetical protein
MYSVTSVTDNIYLRDEYLPNSIFDDERTTCEANGHAQSLQSVSHAGIERGRYAILQRRKHFNSNEDL